MVCSTKMKCGDRAALSHFKPKSELRARSGTAVKHPEQAPRRGLIE
jgi:hypothetical protein